MQAEEKRLTPPHSIILGNSYTSLYPTFPTCKEVALSIVDSIFIGTIPQISCFVNISLSPCSLLPSPGYKVTEGAAMVLQYHPIFFYHNCFLSQIWVPEQKKWEPLPHEFKLELWNSRLSTIGFWKKNSVKPKSYAKKSLCQDWGIKQTSNAAKKTGRETVLSSVKCPTYPYNKSCPFSKPAKQNLVINKGPV